MGASGSAAELFFQLSNASNPNVPVTGVDFTAGDYVYAWYPKTGVFAAASPSQIVEKGLGTFAVQMTSSQSAQDGTAYVFALIPSVSQPFRGSVDIVNPASPARWELPFTVMPLADPVYDADGVGLDWPFTLGQVQQRFSTDGSFSDALLGNIVQRGYNMYAVELTSTQRASDVNAALVAFNASGMVPVVSEWDMIVASYSGGPTPPPPTPTPYVPPVSTGPVDQIALGTSRLALQFRTKLA